jgi:hypothetical protein
LGKDISFEDYLKGDKDFNKAMADKKKGIWSKYWYTLEEQINWI